MIDFFFQFILDECGWCKRIIAFGSSEFSATSEGLKFCSESCFTQSRRASYKRAKTCDWCKHIRHAVSYVDFQDGASQLQFCSDKCLNQYKMQIFCKETQAHLDMNPHLKDKGKSSNENLITPELWMRNCRSRSMTPDQRSNDSRTTESPVANVSVSANPMPTIKVAPVSKLLSCDHDKSNAKHKLRDEPTNELKNYSHFAQKTRALRKRRTIRLGSGSNISIPENMNNNDSANENRNIHKKMHPSNMIGEKNRMNNLLPAPMMSNLPPKISPTIEKNEPSLIHRYQLLSQPAPNLFAMNENRSLQNALRQSAQFIAPLIPNHSFRDSPEILSKMSSGPTPLSKIMPMQRQRSEQPSSNSTAQKHNFIPENNPMFSMQQKLKSQIPLNEFLENVFGSITPPSTLMIPYPIILPIPLPIPIPLPYEAFLRAAQLNKKDNNHSNGHSSSSNSSINEEDPIQNIYISNLNDQPLDFTKDRITSKISKNSDDETDDDDDRSSSNSQSVNETHRKNDVTKSIVNRQLSKRILTKESSSENNRPLRKRKRIIDCDYMRLRDSNSDEPNNLRKSI